jgi:hypothetical protein
MSSDDPHEAVLAFLIAPGFVTAQTNGSDGWVASTGGGGLDALPESGIFVKERHLPKRAAYNVRFTVLLTQGDDGAWQVMGGAGGSAEDPPENAPKRGHPWANLGDGGWPRQFYAGGALEEDNGAVAHVCLRSANGIEMEDIVEDGEVLFLTADAVQTPFELELYDGSGILVARHMTFNFAP